MGMNYDTSSVMSSELEMTSFLESDDDASSRITTTTGRATNLLLGRRLFLLSRLMIIRIEFLRMSSLIVRWSWKA